MGFKLICGFVYESQEELIGWVGVISEGGVLGAVDLSARVVGERMLAVWVIGLEY